MNTKKITTPTLYTKYNFIHIIKRVYKKNNLEIMLIILIIYIYMDIYTNKWNWRSKQARSQYDTSKISRY